MIAARALLALARVTPQLPQVVTQPQAVREAVHQWRARSAQVALVPTMGALHDGHLSLVAAARQECDAVVATIFVNPTQFGPHEDYQRYPRSHESDLQKLGDVGCDLAFLPEVEQMYPDGFDTSVDVGAVARVLEGEYRTTHFAGVATVVLKLFQLVPADCAYFGQKDYQQTVVIRQMARDLNLPIEVCVSPTVREPDGLAMSSRNAYLSPEERRRAVALCDGLRIAQRMHERGERNAEKLRDAVRQRLKNDQIEVQYVAIVRDGGVEPVEHIEGPCVIAVAGLVGRTRLIDNIRIG